MDDCRTPSHPLDQDAKFGPKWGAALKLFSPFQVSISEGRELSRQYNTAFHEVSVADDPVDTINVMNRVVRELWTSKVRMRCDTECGSFVERSGMIFF